MNLKEQIDQQTNCWTCHKELTEKKYKFSSGLSFWICKECH